MISTPKVRKIDGCIVTNYYSPTGELHREDGPSTIHEYPDGRLFCEWYWKDRRHRYGGPAVEYFFDERHSKGSHSQVRSHVMGFYVHGTLVSDAVKSWLDEHGYEWVKMSDVEKWELDMFMRTLG